MLTGKSLGLFVALLMLTTFLAGCGGGTGLPESPVRPVSDTGTGGSGGPPGLPADEDPGAEPGDENVQPPILPPIVYDDSESSGEVVCDVVDTGSNQTVQVRCANDELEVRFVPGTTVQQVDQALSAVDAWKKVHIRWPGDSWVVGIQPAASCDALEAKISQLLANPLVVSAQKNFYAELCGAL